MKGKSRMKYKLAICVASLFVIITVMSGVIAWKACVEPRYRLYTITGTIVDVRYLNSAYCTDAKTILYFDDGSQMIFGDFHTEFKIGHTYQITYWKTSDGETIISQVVEV
jgi:hypothetical protein